MKKEKGRRGKFVTYKPTVSTGYPEHTHAGVPATQPSNDLLFNFITAH